MQWFKKAWKGEEKLWRVFWLYWFLGNIALSLLIPFIALFSLPLVNMIASVVSLISLVYFVMSMILVWRCAFRTKHEYWGYIARVVIFLLPVIFFAIFFGTLATFNNAGR